MCFSATASFSVAAILAPTGAYCIHRAFQTDRKWIPIAMFPLVFSIQQAIEGLVWVGVDSDNTQLVYVASRGFLFFSHFFWLAWGPFAVFWLEQCLWRRTIILWLAVIGALFGISIFLPTLLYPDWLVIEKIRHSLEYKTTLIYEGIVDRSILRVIYAVIIVSAFMLSTVKHVRIFGMLILASVLVTYQLFPHAFISVWCYFAAILSAYILVMLTVFQPSQPPHTVRSG